MTKHRRTRTDVIVDILTAAIEGELKTHIMYQANLSYTQIRRYLPLLQEMGLLEAGREGNWEIYTTTRKGIQFIQTGKTEPVIPVSN